MSFHIGQVLCNRSMETWIRPIPMSFHIGQVPHVWLLVLQTGPIPMSFHIGQVPYFSNQPIIINIDFLGTLHTYSILQIRET